MLAFLLPMSLAGGDLLVIDARLWDATGADVIEDAWLLIRDGRIEQIGSSDPPDPAGLDFDVEVLDVGHDLVLPGLIDSHVHLTAVPGAPWRGEDEAARLPHIRSQLQAYVAAGFTSVLDTGIFPEDLSALRHEVDTGQVAPRLFFLGPVLAPEGGYPAAIVDGFPELATADDVVRELDALVPLGLSGIKTTVESGFVRAIWPVYNDEVFAALPTEAASRGLPIYVHATSEEEQRLALDKLSPHAFVHLVEEPSDAFVEELAASGAFVMPTMVLFDSPLFEFDPARFDDPLVQLLVPPAQLETAVSIEALDGYRADMIRVAVPLVPGFMRAWAGRMGATEEMWRSRVAAGQDVVARLHAAGVPIVLGSDAGSYEKCPFYFHAVSSIRELELLAEAIGPEAALVAATRTPAEMLARDDLGTVEVGKRADLVVVAGDALSDVSALRVLRWTVLDGVAKTPEDWMAVPTANTSMP